MTDRATPPAPTDVPRNCVCGEWCHLSAQNFCEAQDRWKEARRIGERLFIAPIAAISDDQEGDGVRAAKPFLCVSEMCDYLANGPEENIRAALKGFGDWSYYLFKARADRLHSGSRWDPKSYRMSGIEAVVTVGVPVPPRDASENGSGEHTPSDPDPHPTAEPSTHVPATTTAANQWSVRKDGSTDEVVDGTADRFENAALTTAAANVGPEGDDLPTTHDPVGSVDYYDDGLRYVDGIVESFLSARAGDLTAAGHQAFAADCILAPLGEEANPESFRDFIAGVANAAEHYLHRAGVPIRW